MTIRKTDAKEETLRSIDEFSNRAEIRKFMLYVYAVEDCKTKIRYYVEKLSNGKWIYLERPTYLNKGCDFQIFVEDLICGKNGNDKCPSHNDVFEDLRKKKAKLSSQQYQKLLSAIDDIYNVRPYKVAEKSLEGLPDVEGWTYETLLKLIRWLFIEQDITYWAQTGRDMLMTGIKKI